MLHATRTELGSPRPHGSTPAKTYLLGPPVLPVGLPSYLHGKHIQYTHTHTHTHTYTHTAIQILMCNSLDQMPILSCRIFFYVDHF